MRFVTVFPELKNFHLNKDVGLIPKLLSKYKNYNSTIVCYKNDDRYEVEDGLKIEFIDKKFGAVNDIGIYILKNAKKIDVLNLFHITSERNLKWILLYKILNPKGKVYLKLDADKNIEYYTYNKRTLKQKLKNKIVNKIDLITVENFTIKNYIENSWGLKTEFLPNGFYDNEFRNFEFKQKENIILTVGRIGAYQKATDILLKSFAKYSDNIKGWKLVIVGEVEEEFKESLQEFMSENLEIANRLELVGKVDDFNRLREYYRKSKIFCLPSRYESFGLVLVEALMEGCYIITSNHEAASTIVENEKIGKIFEIDDIDDLGEKIIYSCNNVIFNDEKYLEISEYAYKNFYWNTIIDRLDNYLKNLSRS